MLGILVRRLNQSQIEALCEKLHEHIVAQRFDAADHAIEISVGIGVCVVESNPKDPGGLIARAQTALTEAQQQGKRQTRLSHYEEAQSGENQDPQNIVGSALRTCLADGSFSIAYQPLLDLQSRGSESYEMILRVPTPEGDLLLERDYREVAEQTGLSGDIDRWLLERAIDILHQRRASGNQTHLFLRQSSASVTDADLPAWLLGRLRAVGTVGTGLVLDFRLSDLSSDIRGAQKIIAALREFDVEVCLSRFPEKDAAFKVLRFVGANYISVAPRLLKAERDIIGRMIEVTHKVGAKVIVPNIDDPRAIDLHWSSGADFLQGNFIQRPLESMDYDFSQVVI
jgi:EAL domain-containing protein (putative c-di-GMP-specific phosphodiesterase class I)